MSTVASPTLTVIVATYERPQALGLVLAALSEQHDPRFEVLVADDGSGPRTAEVVDRWRGPYGDRLTYVRQADDGFRKSRVANLAALRAEGDQLVFLDGDVIPRRGFVESVRQAIRPGWFLASKRVHLSKAFSSRVLAERLPIWRWSSLHWLMREPREAQRPGYFVALRDRPRPWQRGAQEFTPPDRAHGFCLGMSRADFERVNGYDMRYEGWGGEDNDLVLRLCRAGLRCGWAGPSATLFHLWHPLARANENEPLLFETERSKHTEAVRGLRELAEEPVDVMRLPA